MLGKSTLVEQLYIPLTRNTFQEHIHTCTRTTQIMGESIPDQRCNGHSNNRKRSLLTSARQEWANNPPNNISLQCEICQTAAPKEI